MDYLSSMPPGRVYAMLGGVTQKVTCLEVEAFSLERT